jgi:small neutral amino acid transporter SnatA (MarC family)
MYKSSVARIEIGKIPVMSLVGLANALFLLLFLYSNWVDDLLGSNSIQSLTLILGILIISFVLYWIIRTIRKSQGIDLDAQFKKIPPE